MSDDELKVYLLELKSQYDFAKQDNTELSRKLRIAERKERKMGEENKQAIIQAETVNMMTKYQLVFVKMENAFGKVLNSRKVKELN